MTDFTDTGTIQYETITTSGTYELTLDGAQGGSIPDSSDTGGFGASVTGDIFLAAGTQLEIVVGVQGAPGDNGPGYRGGAGGGGGTFVIDETDNTILAVAGGGGGGADFFYNSAGAGGTTATGGHGNGTGGGAGGMNGAAGGGGLEGRGSSRGFGGGGGGGFTGGAGSDRFGTPGNGGAAPSISGASGSTAGTTFDGGAGGSQGLGGVGGFGGGGGGGRSGGGGGGGYGGGGGGGGGYGGSGGTDGGAAGGGGGSYYADLTNVAIAAGENRGGGLVVVTELSAACYLRGAAIRTPSGDVPVECLQPGDRVSLHDGGSAPVLWLGHRAIDCTKHPQPREVWPVVIRADAFGEGLPARDLWLSPGHALFVGGVLIQAEKLVNGATIVQVPRPRVEYWHVELDRHAVILAEGLPAESYLDQGNRVAFENGGAFIEAHPDFRPKHWAQTCAPLVLDGPPLRAARAALLARAAGFGYAVTAADDLHVLADGKRVEPVALGDGRRAFLLPPGVREASLRSRTFVPAQVDPHSDDWRELGVRVRRWQRDGVGVALHNDALFADGWHAHEPDGARWTTGRAPVPAGTRLLVLDLAGNGQYWTRREQNRGNVVAMLG